jgi:hypothetical protein
MLLPGTLATPLNGGAEPGVPVGGPLCAVKYPSDKPPTRPLAGFTAAIICTTLVF